MQQRAARTAQGRTILDVAHVEPELLATPHVVANAVTGVTRRGARPR